MGWNLVREDFEFMMRLEPEGCFVLLSDSKRIGMVTTISFDKTGWLGNVIVSEDHRKQGAGSLLVNHAAKFLTRKNAKAIGIYAYLDKIPFYRRLGFECDSEFTVLKGIGFSSAAGANVREAEQEEVKEIIEFDRACFGASRKKLLEPILLDPDSVCYVAAERERIFGYAAATVYEKMAELGPLACRRECNDIAISLLRAILNRLEGFEVSMCISKKESFILNMLKSNKFKEQSRVMRMFFGSPLLINCIYGAESLERG